MNDHSEDMYELRVITETSMCVIAHLHSHAHIKVLLVEHVFLRPCMRDMGDEMMPIIDAHVDALLERETL